ncbi:MAG: hypothetical protein IMW89_12325 [Ktedonobacteraceae bacterium]|nr:hypothetical protein [Ktedonobacteraceae bacterium]
MSEEEEEEEEELAIPGHVSINRAANMVGVSRDRIEQILKEEPERLPHKRVGGRIMIQRSAVENYQRGIRKPVGRTRVKPPDWRVYRGGGKVSGTEIQVRMRPGKRKELLTRLQNMLKQQEHTLTGSITRYIFEDRADPDLVTIWLAWKNTEMPEEEQHEQELEAFKDGLDDVLDWSTAVIREKDGIIYT